MDRRMQTARTGLLRIVCGLLVIAFGSAAQAEFVWQNVSGGIPGPLGYNQERRIVRDADNGYLHVTFDNQGAVWYSWSEDNGETWLPDVPPPDNNREEIEGLGMTHGYGAIGVDRANTPWVSWVYGGQVGAEQNKLEGGIRTGGTWVKGESLSPFFPPAEYAGMDQGAIAVTKCPVPTDVAVAYSVVPAEKWNFMGPTGHKYLFLVAWGLDGGVVRSFPTATTTLDYQFLPNAPHVLRASIAVQKDGQSDVIHVVWQRREDNTTRIYHVQSAPITPQQVRAGQPLVWSVRFPVSQSQQQPVTEQATFPSVDFKDRDPNSTLDDAQLIVAWHGPNNNGGFPGDVWRRIRYPYPRGWDVARNVSYQGFGANVESEFPEASTPDVVAWQEDQNEWDIYGNFWGNMDRIVVREGEDKWPHIAAKHWDNIAAVDCHTLWARPGANELHYKEHTYIPRGLGPGGQSAGRLRLGEGEAWLYPVPPVTGRTRAVFRYFVPDHARVELALYDQAGRRTRTLDAAVLPPGLHASQWDGKTDAGCYAPAGTYVCVLKTPTAVKTQPVRVVR